MAWFRKNKFVMIKKIFHFLKKILYQLSGFSIRRKNIVIFGAWFGTQVTDNSMYLLNDFISNNLDKKFRFIWIGNEDCKVRLYNIYGNKVQFCRRNSLRSFYFQCIAKYAFVNQGFLDFGVINLLKGAELVQLWHGFPIKKIVADAENFTQTSIYYHCDFFLSTSKIMDTRMLSAFKYWGCNKSNLLQIGQPRYLPLMCEKEDSSLKEKLGIPVNATVVSYIPTFRDHDDYMFSFQNISDQQNKKLLDSNIYVIEKQHFVRNKNVSSQKKNIIELPRDFDTQQLLRGTDILVTDFSSVYIDFLILNRQIIHFTYDLQKFINSDRGLYNEAFVEDAAGPIVESTDDLIEELIISDSKQFEEKREELNSLFNEYSTDNIGLYIAKNVGMI